MQAEFVPGSPNTLRYGQQQTHGTQKLKLLLKRQIEKVKVPRRVRSPRNTKDADNSDDDDAPRATKYERLERVVRRQLTRGKAARQKLQGLAHTGKKKNPRGSRRGSSGGFSSEGYASETGSRRQPQGVDLGCNPLAARNLRRSHQKTTLDEDDEDKAEEPAVYPSDALRIDDSESEFSDEDDDDEVSDDDDDIIFEDDYFEDLELDYEDELTLRRRVGSAVENKLRRASREVRLASLALGSSVAVLALVIVVNFVPRDALARSLALVASGVTVVLHLEAFRETALRLGATAASSARFGKDNQLPSKGHRPTTAKKRHLKKKRSGSVSTIESPRTPPKDDAARDKDKKTPQHKKPRFSSSSSKTGRHRSTTLPPPMLGATEPREPRPRRASQQQQQPPARSLSPRRGSILHWQVPMVSSEEQQENTWARVPASKFSLRGPNYVADRCKLPSAAAIYEPVDIHVYDSRGMTGVFDEYPNLLAALGEQQRTPTHHDQPWALPRYLGLTLNVPKEAPSMRGFWPGSPCYTIVCIFKLSDDARRVLENANHDEWPRAYTLLRAWLDTADKDPAMNGRLKGIFFCRSAVSPADDNDRLDSATNHAAATTSVQNETGGTAASPTAAQLPTVKEQKKSSSPNSSSPQERLSADRLPTAPLSASNARGFKNTARDDSAVVYERRLVRANSIDSSEHVPRTTVKEDDDDDDEDNAAAPGGRGLPRILQKWNGKPVLMAENASGFSRHRKGISKLIRGPNYVEVCINVGESFSYMGRGAVYVMLGKLQNLAVDVCFTIEGRSTDELPEAVLGCLNFSSMKLHDKFKDIAAANPR
mmetsp:Transcript_12735/g.38415  ORF Transcript_12735/g.38415 Transcript_12735/m.38415 type:complete len:824 (+) Transcript_12735:118-2589(+)